MSPEVQLMGVPTSSSPIHRALDPEQGALFALPGGRSILISVREGAIVADALGTGRLVCAAGAYGSLVLEVRR